MCGFAGIINREGKLSKQQVADIASHVSFRGPDHMGISVYDTNFVKQDSGHTVFFFNRLSILDLDSRANQPFEDDRYTLLFNGEIYNYKFIKSELQNKGVVFHTTSDTEVLFYALIYFGATIIERLNGMFAFVFIDKLKHKFIMARDRMGIKPLYFAFQGKSMAFGSEIDSVVRLLPKKPNLSKKSISLYLALQYIPTPHTIWEGIAKFPPGCYMEGSLVNLGQSACVTHKVYWDAYKQIEKEPFEQDLESLLVESIKSQMQADVPLGFFLSSGIDSSLLAAVVNKHFQDKQFNFFTVAFNQHVTSDESNDAGCFLRGFNNHSFAHHLLYISPDSLKQSITTMYKYVDEPFGDYAMMLNYGISQKAKEHVTVALSGDGADELFWGYPRYNQWSKYKTNFLNKWWFSPLRLGLRFLPAGRLKSALLYRTENDHLALYFYIVTSRLRNIDAIVNDHSSYWRKGIDRLSKREDLASVVDLKTYLPDCMFYKVDRSSMGASLEVRVFTWIIKLLIMVYVWI